jgi:hypothetical protein
VRGAYTVRATDDNTIRIQFGRHARIDIRRHYEVAADAQHLKPRMQALMKRRTSVSRTH